MKARPILFSAPMVLALLAGTKTQTRRIVKRTALQWLDDGFTPEFIADPGNASLCPCGKAGDLLYARETWLESSAGHFIYRANWREDAKARGFDNIPADESSLTWRPSIHMPRRASRLTLEITDVRVERLCDISATDALAEGVLEPSLGQVAMIDHGNPVGPVTRADVPPLVLWEFLWKRINGDASWDANPWVWVLIFKVHQQNVDALLSAREAA